MNLKLNLMKAIIEIYQKKNQEMIETCKRNIKDLEEIINNCKKLQNDLHDKGRPVRQF